MTPRHGVFDEDIGQNRVGTASEFLKTFTALQFEPFDSMVGYMTRAEYSSTVTARR